MRVYKLTNTIEENMALASKIMKGMPENNVVKNICSINHFYADPIKTLFLTIISGKEIVGEGFDEGCSFMIGQIPNFWETATNMDYFKGILIEHCILMADPKVNMNLIKIMQVFERSIQSEKFQNDINQAYIAYNQAKCETMNFQDASLQFLKCISIIRKSIMLEDY